MRKAILKKGTGTKATQFKFNLIGDNNEPLGTSEFYTRKEKAVQTLRKYFPDFAIVDDTKPAKKPKVQEWDYSKA